MVMRFHRWFRVYDDLIDDPKVQLLPPPLFKHLINLWCITSENDGVLPSARDIAFRLRVTNDEVVQILDELVSRSLLDHDDIGLRPHNWNERQFKSDLSSDRVKRFRERQRNVTRNADETFHDRFMKRSDSVSVSVSVSDSVSEEESKKAKKEEGGVTRARRVVAPGWPPDYRDTFWLQYPHKIGKAAAMTALDKIARAKDAPSWLDLMAALGRYAAKTDDRPWCNPATWLNQHRWTDRPALPTKPHRETNYEQGERLKAELERKMRGEAHANGSDRSGDQTAGELSGKIMLPPVQGHAR
jgi:hypothetical protein